MEADRGKTKKERKKNRLDTTTRFELQKTPPPHLLPKEEKLEWLMHSSCAPRNSKKTNLKRDLHATKTSPDNRRTKKKKIFLRTKSGKWKVPIKKKKKMTKPLLWYHPFGGTMRYQQGGP